MSQQQGGHRRFLENQLLQEVVRIADLKVKDVMTPRVDMVAFNIKEPPEMLLARFRQSHLAKIPVYEGQIDNIIGLIYAKTLLLEIGSLGGEHGQGMAEAPAPRRSPPPDPTRPFCPGAADAGCCLLVHFRQTKTQLAIVVDEFGGVVGVVALEDVVEQMVGDIYEPYDALAMRCKRVGPQ